MAILSVSSIITEPIQISIEFTLNSIDLVISNCIIIYVLSRENRKAPIANNLPLMSYFKRINIIL